MVFKDFELKISELQQNALGGYHMHFYNFFLDIQF